MAQFDFQLDGVLRHRKSVEKERQRAMAVVQQQMQQLQDELKALDQSVQDATNELRASQLAGRIDLNYLAAHRRFVAATQRKAMETVQKMALLQRKVDEARKQLTQAAMERKVMEKLREKQFERWKGDMDRKETAQMDEIGMQMNFRNLAAESAENRGEP